MKNHRISAFQHRITIVLRFCGVDKPIVPDHQNFDTKNVRHSITRKKGPKVIGIICLDMAKVLFVTKEIEDPVSKANCCDRNKNAS